MSEQLKCPKCGCSAHQKRGKDRKGSQVYKCKKCGSAFMAKSDYRYAQQRSKCPFCSGKTRKEGFSQTGAQKCLCLECRRHFLDGEKQKIGLLPAYKVQKTIMYLHIKGLKQSDIAKMVGISCNSVSRINRKRRAAS